MRGLYRGLLWGFSGGIALCLGLVVLVVFGQTEKVELPAMPVGSAELATYALWEIQLAEGVLRGMELSPLELEDSPKLLTDREIERFESAQQFLSKRTAPMTPYAINAMIGGTGGLAGFGFCWLEADEDTVGLIVLEHSRSNGTAMKEEYPVFLCASEGLPRSARTFRPFRQVTFDLGKAEQLGGDSLKHQGFVLRWRTASQSKDEEYWRTYTAADREERKTMRKPVMWISRPNGRKVSIVIYDKAGNRSVPVEVVEVGENNTWLR